MKITHPRAGEAPLPSVVAGSDGERYRIDDGVVSAPESVAKNIADAWARRYGVDRDRILTNDGGDDGGVLVNADDKSDAALIDAGVCPWCDGYEGENVGLHASSAHPEQWATYKERSED